MKTKQTSEQWVTFTRRTEDPKLAWIETKLAEMGIPCRRNGSSWHAPILEVQAQHLRQANEWLQSPFGNRQQTVDDVPDDDPTFVATGSGLLD